jgi:uncharacterized integral membrane protein
MNRSFFTPGRILAIASSLAFIIFWAVWFFAYRYFLIWLEGYSFFSTLPDFSNLYKAIPEGLPGYIGAFLHQFYKWPAAGAAIQALMTVWPVICTGVIVNRLFENPGRLLWIAFLPLPYFVFRQFWDLHMYFAVIYNAAFTGIMLIVLIFTLIRKVTIKVPKWVGSLPVNILIMLSAIGTSLYFLLVQDERNHEQNDHARLEYLGENGRWMEILERVTPADAHNDDIKRHYALLALAQTGHLTDYAFLYGLDGSDSFLFYDNINPLCLDFNAIFYQSMAMPNAVIHQSYQLGVQSVAGVGFSSIRRLADTYIDLKDYALAKKYVDILAHSTCHRAWVKDRLPKLEAIKNASPAYANDEFNAMIAEFPHTISSMVDRNRKDRRYADLLMCALLADEEGDKFLNIFRYIAEVQYPDGKNLPRLYEEALILISMVDPSALQGIHISNDTQQRFADYVALMNAGKRSQALRKYKDTYWAYLYRAQ